MYKSTLSLASALDGVGGQRHALAALPPRETRYPLYGRMDRAHGHLEGCGESRSPPGSDPWIVQPVASQYTEYPIPADLCCVCFCLPRWYHHMSI